MKNKILEFRVNILNNWATDIVIIIIINRLKIKIIRW